MIVNNYVRLVATGKSEDVPLLLEASQWPFGIFDVVRYVAVILAVGEHVHLVSVIGPWSELHGAVLFVKREELHVDGTRTLKDDHRQPGDVSLAGDDHVGTNGRFERLHVSAVDEKTTK